MSKVSKWVASFLLITETLIYGSCISFFKHQEKFDRKSIFSLLPSHDEEYIPPIPVHFRNSYGFGRNLPPHIPRASRSQIREEGSEERPWIPLQNSHGSGTIAREVYLQPMAPLAYRRHVSVTRLVTEQPTSFDIPLRKSIRVSHTAPVQPAIQTTGYIKDSSPRKVPSDKGTNSPKRIEPQKLNPSNRTFFEENWRPHRISSSKFDMKPKSISNDPTGSNFKQYLNTKIDKHLNYTGIRHDNQDLSGLSTTNKKEVNGSNLFSDDSEFSKYINENLGKYDTFFPQPEIKKNANINDDTLVNSYDRRNTSQINHLNKNSETGRAIQHKQNENAGQVSNQSAKEYNIGVFYADEEKKNSVTSTNRNIKPIGDKVKNITLFVDGKVVGHIPSQKSKSVTLQLNDTKRNDESSPKKDLQDSHSSTKIAAPDNNQSQMTKSFSHNKNAETDNIKKNSRESEDKEQPKKTKIQPAGVNNKPQTEIFQDHKSVTIHGAPENGTRLKHPNYNQVPSLIEGKIKDHDLPQSIVEPFSKTPFYGDSRPKPADGDFLKDIKLDDVYFSPVFPEKSRPEGVDKQNSEKEVQKQEDDTSVTFLHKTEQVSAKSLPPDKERLIELHPTHHNKNQITKEYTSDNQGTHINLNKAGNFNHRPSFSNGYPTSPSLITINPDVSILGNNINHNFGIKRNRTDTYILERKPALLPDTPGTTHPRKPNIRLTSGMLAGILIAALIFLGFLTGTMVFAVHQFKFSSARSKKKERQKKRVTTFAPEYVDDTFAGNTYIHNNIFLPNPQNLEDRDSPELDTSFSVDSEETMPMPDRPSTSSNSRGKTPKKNTPEENKE